MHIKEPNILRREQLVLEVVRTYYVFSTEDIYDTLWGMGYYVDKRRIGQILRNAPGVIKLKKNEHFKQIWKREVSA